MNFDVNVVGSKDDALEALDRIVEIIKKNNGSYQAIHVLNAEKVRGMKQIEQMIRDNIICENYTIESNASSQDYNNGTITIRSSSMVMFKNPEFINTFKDRLIGIDIDALTSGGVEMVFSVRTTDRL